MRCDIKNFDIKDSEILINSGNIFQIPEKICKYMASFLPKDVESILVPFAGQDKLVKELKQHGNIFVPYSFYEMLENKFDWIVVTQRFTQIEQEYKVLYECMNMSNNIIALMFYQLIFNNDKVIFDIMDWGLKSITLLPKSIFKKKENRIQTCILEMKKGYQDDTIFKTLPI